MSAVSFAVSPGDYRLIEQIAERATRLHIRFGIGGPAWRLQDAQMDITAVHANGTPLRLCDLLLADDANFGHDVFGIRRYLNRNTGQLTSCFVPRFAAPHTKEAT